tara:strand:- start:50 stop:460 length:411 start_codon:yes stop_codon:yes gene_type:complete
MSKHKQLEDHLYELAECCGLWFDDKYGRWHGEGIPQILASHGISASGLMEGLPEGAWNPLTNWNHLRLVLEQLRLWSDLTITYCLSTDNVTVCLYKRCVRDLASEVSIRVSRDDLPSAICSAALAVMKEKHDACIG